MIRVAADLRWPAGTGIGIVQRELLQRCPDSVRVTGIPVAGRIGSPLSPLRVAVALREQKDADVYWSPGFVPPLSSRVPVVVTVHDLTHLHYYSKLHALYYSLVLRPLYRRCARIICVSAFTRDEFLGWSGVDPERIVVIHNGLAEPFLAHGRSDRVVPKTYVLYSGNRRSYKNIQRLVEAYARSVLPGMGITLLLTGVEDAETRNLARRHGVSSHVRFSGILDDAGIVDTYRQALAVAFVSLYEGFGLPLIEAMGSGVPVLCSNVSSLPEVAGNAAILVDPRSVQDIADGLEQVCLDLVTRERLIAAGYERARHFNWDRAATSTWRVVQEVAETSARTGDIGESDPE